MNITWDADKYTEDFSFVHQYGNQVADWIEAEAGSTVLDLGCGNGALTNGLKEKGFAVMGMDASQAFLEIARNHYPDILFIQADATKFSLEQPVDVVFSNAVFHWIDPARQPELLRCVYQALKENGEFVFEFGGQGNNRLIHRALAEVFSACGYAYKMPFYFPGIGEYAALLEQAGFQARRAVLFDRPTALNGEQGLKDWLNMFVKTPFSVVKSPEDREKILDDTVEQLREALYKDGRWYADYVRLRMRAIKK